MEKERDCIAAMCKCGGWVMLAVLGHSVACDKESFAEAGELAAKGFTIRTPVSVSECRKMTACKHQGDCTTDPEKVRVSQESLALVVSP